MLHSKGEWEGNELGKSEERSEELGLDMISNTSFACMKLSKNKCKKRFLKKKNSTFRDKDRWISEFQASLVYVVRPFLQK